MVLNIPDSISPEMPSKSNDIEGVWNLFRLEENKTEQNPHGLNRKSYGGGYENRSQSSSGPR